MPVSKTCKPNKVLMPTAPVPMLKIIMTAATPHKNINSQRPMPENSSERSSKRVLDPIDRVSEVLFGLIMVLTITGSLSVAEAGRDDVRTMLFGALGCNLAWGIIDGVLYVMGSLAEKGRIRLVSSETVFKTPRNAAVAFSMFTLRRTARSTSSSALFEATKWRF
jgi:hypothetical protein